VEGAISLILAPIAYFWVPNRMDTAWFLNKEQRRQAVVRYEMNKQNYNEDEQFEWAEVRKAVTSWTVRIARSVILGATDRRYTPLEQSSSAQTSRYTVSPPLCQLTQSCGTIVLIAGLKSSAPWGSATSMHSCSPCLVCRLPGAS